MSTVNDYLNQAELALAAYGNFLFSGIPDIQELMGNNAGMSTKQADEFSKQWRVVAPTYNNANGLSATVFADASGKTYLAIRGTEMTAQDLLTDMIDIALFGTTAFQSQYATLKAKVEEQKA